MFFLAVVVSLQGCSKTQQESKNIENTQSSVLTAHLSSGWYPQEREKLLAELASYFSLAKKEFGVVVDPNSVKALIVPHAGMSYSGLCAASAYQTLITPAGQDVDLVKNKKIKKVFVLSPSHTIAFNGVALPHFDVYRNVLGEVQIDTDIVKKLLKKTELFKSFPVLADVFSKEHAIEIQLPFIQRTIHDFKIIPMIVGRFKDNQVLYNVAEELKKFIDDESLVIVSTDFTHFGPAYKHDIFSIDKLDSIRYIDSLAVRSISVQSVDAFDRVVEETQSTICGQEPLKILLGLCELEAFKSVEPKVTCYYSSAQIVAAYDAVTGLNVKKLLSKVADSAIDNCVSYLGMIFSSQKQSKLTAADKLTGFEKKSLIAGARASVENALKEKKYKTPEHLVGPLVSPGLEKITGCFVTLTKKNGSLRGCIGRIATESEPLFKLVPQMAQAAAFNDTRFKPLYSDELDSLNFSITILSAPSEVESYKDIKIGKHGIILNKYTGGLLTHSAVFLPQVPTEYKWNLETTLRELSIKAGLNEDTWKEDCKFMVFEGFEIKE